MHAGPMAGEITKQRTQGWRRSTRCEAGNCVEAAPASGGMLLRNSTRPTDVLFLPHEQWAAFLSAVCRGDFRPPA
jgi:hypothetical protein